jgi:transketolase
MTKHNSMRGYFAFELYEQMKLNKDIFILLGDLGYGMFDYIREKMPDRIINTGAAEQSLVDIGIGLALDGKIPVCYSITPFILYRPFESIRTYINYENIPVKLIGSGRDKDYEHDGISHWADDDKNFMNQFKNIESYWPETKEEINKEFVNKLLNNDKPIYLNLRR